MSRCHTRAYSLIRYGLLRTQACRPNRAIICRVIFILNPSSSLAKNTVATSTWKMIWFPLATIARILRRASNPSVDTFFFSWFTSRFWANSFATNRTSYCRISLSPLFLDPQSFFAVIAFFYFTITSKTAEKVSCSTSDIDSESVYLSTCFVWSTSSYLKCTSKF